MRARAEQESRVEAQGHPAPVGAVYPLRYDEELFANLYGLVVLLPVILPVGVAHGREPQLELRPDGVKQRRALVAVLDVKLNARHAPVAFLEGGVDIVPVLAVIFKKGSEIILVFDDKAGDAEGREPVADLVGVPAFYRYFRVVHFDTSKLPRQMARQQFFVLIRRRRLSDRSRRSCGDRLPRPRRRTARRGTRRTHARAGSSEGWPLRRTWA